MEYGKKVQVLMLDDCKHEPCFVTKNEHFSSYMELIKKLREPHGRLYEFRSVCFDDLDEWEEEIAWYHANIAHIPHPLDPGYNRFSEAFDLLWRIGMEV